MRTAAFLPWKLAPPPRAAHEVARAQISDQVFSGGGARLVLVRGPAGYGKSTVMRQLFDHCALTGLAASWVNCEAADNDLSRFLSLMVIALRRLDADADLVAAGSADAGADLELIEQLGMQRGPFMLFMDEFEVLQNPSIHALLRRLLLQLPAGAQIVMGTRSVPDLGLGRLRAMGWLLEIDTSLLRFSFEEASELLRRRGHPDLRTEQIDSLHRSTEGWAAALWLASVAMQSRGAHTSPGAPSLIIEGFAGSQAGIAEYLAEDVLARQTPQVQDFLLQTSILHTLDASLCNAVCQRNDSAQMLAELDRANLFVSAVDETRQGFRYHPLFAGFLRTQLGRTTRFDIARLNLAASEWFVAQSRPVPAIEHALAAQARGQAIALLLHHAGRLLADGRTRLLGRWLAQLTREELHAHPELQIIQVWCTHFTKGAREAMVLFRDCDTASWTGNARAYALTIHPILLSMLDRIEEALTIGQRNLDQLGEAPALARGMLATSVAFSVLLNGNEPDVRRHLDLARQADAADPGRLGSSFADTAEGALDLMHGRLVRATARLRAAMQPDRGRVERQRNAMAGVLLAEALYESNDLSQAERLLNVCVPIVREVGIPDQLISAYVHLSRIVRHAGDTEVAFQLLDELETVAARADLARARASARLERARLSLARGDATAAREELDRAQDSMTWTRVAAMALPANDVEDWALGDLRWRIRTGRSEEILSLVQELITAAELGRRQRRWLKLRIFQAEALWRLDRRKAAFTALGDALMVAAREGFVRSFVDEGPVVAACVRDYLTTQAGQALRASSAEAERNLRLLSDSLRDGNRVLGPLPSSAPNVEQLTRKEIEVLALMEQGLSNRALAQKLFVSEATIRTHLRNISAKLGASSRTEAVAIGRRSGLIT